MKSSILVTGSGGFIGSHLVKCLLQRPHVTLPDDIPETLDIHGIDVRDHIESDRYHHILRDISSDDFVDHTLNDLKHIKVMAIIHLAARISVGEGQVKREEYRRSNIIGTQNLIELAIRLQDRQRSPIKFIFASSAAVYKIHKSETVPGSTPQLIETDPLGPVSYYGETKLIGERMIQEATKRGLQSVVFRFFNVAGGREIHRPPIHLIPILLDRVIRGEPLLIFGSDYPTRDGTCERDYFHVDDLIGAITLVLDRWTKSDGGFMEVYNLGSSKSYTVLEVCHTMLRILSHKKGMAPVELFQDSNIKCVERRDGDPAYLLANCDKIRDRFGWSAALSLERIILDTIDET